MRVLIVSKVDNKGGAARAAYRLHNALRVVQIDSRMLVCSKFTNDSTVTRCRNSSIGKSNRFRNFIDGLPSNIYPKRTGDLFSVNWVSSSSLLQDINMLDPDIVHLHWITGGMLSIEDVAKINRPIVWSLHDMWPFTGGCHYSGDCDHYIKNCGACKMLGSISSRDLSSLNWFRKWKSFSSVKDLTIIGLSQWIADRAKESSLFRDRRVLNLPNTIDTDLYRPRERKNARLALGLPLDKKIVLFGAMSATSDLRKGYRELLRSLKHLPNDVDLAVFGSSDSSLQADCVQRVHFLGNLIDDDSLVDLYNAADVMVVPSLQENLSNAILESLACGVPVVCFDIGGNSDLVHHKENGYLAKPFDVTDLAQGVMWFLEGGDSVKVCSDKARLLVEDNFAFSVVAEQYRRVYKEILGI